MSALFNVKYHIDVNVSKIMYIIYLFYVKTML